MFTTSSTPSGSTAEHRRSSRIKLLSSIVLAVAVALSLAGCSELHGSAPIRRGTTATTLMAPAICSGSPIDPIAPPQNEVDAVALDTSLSTESQPLRVSYEAAALALVNQAASEKSALKVVAFGASGVGAKVVSEGSFAPKSDDDIYNLAAQNRLLCWARYAITKALAMRTTPRDTGTDVAGATSSLIADARSLVVPGGSASVTVFTDGCQAPSPSGLNRNLTDLCRLLASGESPTRILRAHAAEFSLGDAHGVTITMKGVGIGRNQNAANTTLARRTSAFWRIACQRARARTCEIGSAVS
jgi:hypothetical protein